MLFLRKNIGIKCMLKSFLHFNIVILFCASLEKKYFQTNLNVEDQCKQINDPFLKDIPELTYCKAILNGNHVIFVCFKRKIIRYFFFIYFFESLKCLLYYTDISAKIYSNKIYENISLN